MLMMGRSKMRISRLGTIVVPAILAGALLSGVYADTIVRKNGTKMADMVVVLETIKETKYKLGDSGIMQSMDSKKIARVEYESIPLAYEQAEADRKTCLFPSAINNYQKAMAANPQDYPWARQYAMFGIAETLRAWAEAGDISRFSQAIGAYQGLLKFMPDTIHFYGCQLGMAKCLLAMKKYNEASGLFDKVIADNYDDRYTIQAQIGKARILEVHKKFREAKHKYREIYNKARSLASSDPSAKDIPNQALVREGACLVGMGKIDEAMSFFEDLIKQAESDEVLAGAHNGVGDCYYKKRRMEDAMWAFLKVAIVFEHITSEAPKAFYYAYASMSEVAGKMKDQNKARDWKGRAKGLKAELRRKFPGSPYARKN
jgi:tetratricopeptide (TPR) repeat protein